MRPSSKDARRENGYYVSIPGHSVKEGKLEGTDKNKIEECQRRQPSNPGAFLTCFIDAYSGIGFRFSVYQFVVHVFKCLWNNLLHNFYLLIVSLLQWSGKRGQISSGRKFVR